MPSSTPVRHGVVIRNVHRLRAAFPNPHKGRLLPVCCLRWVACSVEGHDEVGGAMAVKTRGT
jgi:hypothetical protein